MFNKIDNVGISVSNLEKSILFYEKIGFVKTWSSERGCVLEQGPIKLFLFQSTTPNPQKVDRKLLDLQGNPIGIDHVSFEVDDVDQTYEELKQKGIEVDCPPTNEDWGARVAGFKDPDGNTLYFLKWLN